MTSEHTADADDRTDTNTPARLTDGTPVPASVHDSYSPTERAIAADAIAFMVREGAIGGGFEIARQAVKQQFPNDEKRGINTVDSFCAKAWYPLQKKNDGRGTYVITDSAKTCKQVYKGLTGDDLTVGYTPDEPEEHTVTVTMSWEYIEEVENALTRLDAVTVDPTYDEYPPSIEVTGLDDDLREAWSRMVDVTKGGVADENPEIQDAFADDD